MPSRTRRRDKADKQARIAAAARELFEDRGFEGTTIRAIAERAEVATGTVLLYGERKTELLFALFVDDLEATIAVGEATLDRAAPLHDQLAHLFFGLLELYAARPALARVYVKETLFLPPSPQADRYEAVTRAFLDRLAALIGTHPLRPEVDAPATAIAAFGTHLVHVVALLRMPSNPVDEVRRSLHDALHKLVAPLRA